MRYLLTLAILSAAPAASAVTVLTNFPGPPTISNGIKGTGGFLPAAIEYSFEFTVGGGDHDLTSVSISFGTHLGAVPVTVELYSSPSGPDTATFLRNLPGTPQPHNQVGVFAPDVPVTLTAGDTYLVRLWVNGNASQYGIHRTSTPATGTWSMGNYFTRTVGSAFWNPGGFSPETMVEIEANPVPEPAAAALGSAGLLLLLRRRR